MEEIVNDPELSQYFVIFRKQGTWVNGVWATSSTPFQISCYGPVIAMNEKELVQVPEGDRIHGAMIFYTPRSIPLFTSHEDPGTSDEILWGHKFWKIIAVNLYERFGYYKGYGVRLKGS